VLVDKNEALHRTGVNAWINSRGDPEESSKRGHVVIFDVLQSDDKDVRSYPLKERLELLSQFKNSEHIHFDKPTTDLGKKALSYIMNAEDISEIKKITEKILRI